MIGRTNVGSGFVNVKAKNYTVLPASGRQNDIAVINGAPITDTIVSIDEPQSPTEGMVWIQCAFDGTCYLDIGNIRIYLTSAKQWVSDAWVVLTDWYCYNNDQWVRGRYYLLREGSFVSPDSLVEYTLKLDSGTSTSLTVTSNTRDPLYYALKNSNSSGHNGLKGFRSAAGAWGMYSRLVVELSTSSSALSSKTYLTIIPASSTFVTENPVVNYNFGGNATTRVTRTIDIPTPYAEPCYVYLGMTCAYNGNIKNFTIFNVYLE